MAWSAKARLAAALARRRRRRPKKVMPKVRHMQKGHSATAVGSKRFGSVPPSQRRRKR